MLDLIYITHLQQGKQKNLAYALGLAKAFSSLLSILPISRLTDPKKGKILVWGPKMEEVENDVRPALQNKTKHRKKEQKLPVFLLGKSSQQDHPDALECTIVQQVIDSGFPLFILPFNYPFKKIRKVLFTGNAPGFTGHPLKHQIAATFLPKAFKLENSEVQPIHWSNICHIPESNRSKAPFSSRHLNSNIQGHGIDLTVFPVTNTLYSTCSEFNGAVGELLLYKTPTLLIPLIEQDSVLRGREKDHSYPLVHHEHPSQIKYCDTNRDYI